MSNIIGDRWSVDEDDEDALDEWLRHELHNLHTAQPCEVISFDKDRATVDIKLGVLRDITGVSVNVSSIYDVPVSYPCTSKFKMTFPIKVGDTGLAIFCESSIDRWLTRPAGSNKGYQNPLDTRMHDYTDAVFIPGIKRYAEVEEISDDVVLEFGETTFTLRENGTFSMTGQGGVDFVHQVIQALSLINSVPTVGGVANLEVNKLRNLTETQVIP